MGAVSQWAWQGGGPSVVDHIACRSTTITTLHDDGSELRQRHDDES